MSQHYSFGIGAGTCTDTTGARGHGPLNDLATLLQGRELPIFSGVVPSISFAAANTSALATTGAHWSPQTQQGSRLCDLRYSSLLLAASRAASSASFAVNQVPCSAATAAAAATTPYRWFAPFPPGQNSVAGAASLAADLPGQKSAAGATGLADIRGMAATVPGAMELLAACGHVAMPQKRAASESASQQEDKEQSEDYFSTHFVNKKARHAHSWDELFGALVAFRAVHGHCNVPRDHADMELALWVRELHARRHFLSREQRYKLDLVGYPIEAAAPTTSVAAAATMNPVLAALGSASLPTTALSSPNILASVDLYRLQQRSLATVAAHQMAANQAQRLSESRAQATFVASTGVQEEDEQWNVMFQKLQAHQFVTGGFDGLASGSNDPSLRLWMKEQKKLYRTGAMPEYRKAKLVSVNLINDGTTNTHKKDGEDKKKKDASQQKQNKESVKRRVRSFEENFKALLEYKNEHGNVDVPQKCEDMD
jgi:Helicase associated domain